MNNTVLIKVLESLKAILVAIQPSPPTALFKGVYLNGDEVDPTLLPYAIIGAGTEVPSETNSRTYLDLTVLIVVVYDLPSGSTPTSAGASILGEIKKAINADRFLTVLGGGALATDTSYDGGGSAFVPSEDEVPSATWEFLAEFTVKYRHKTEDPTQVM